jgi:hypothetical protein
MFLLVVPSAVFAGGTGKTGFHGLTAKEKSLLGTLDYNHAWQQLEYLTGQERLVGSAEVMAAQEYIYGQFMSMGMDSVTMEHFKTKSWTNYGATISIVSPVMKSLPGEPYADSHSIWGLESKRWYYFGNSPDGKTLTAPVIDAGKGTDAELSALGDLTGKIALVLRDDDQQGWPNVPLKEAEVHGAAAVVFYGYYDGYPLPDGIKQDVVGESLPALSISINSADEIKQLLQTGEVRLSISGRADLIDDNHARGTNVAAYLIGSKYPDQYIVFSAHIDNWWGVASDDTSGIACVLEYARLFSQARASGLYTNERTLVFCAFDGEEFGGPDGGWYNWLIGSYEWVKAHGDIVDRTVVDLNLDMVCIPKHSGKYWLEQSPDINDLVKAGIDDLGMTGQVSYYNPAYSWVDAWSFNAKGGTSSVNAWWVVNQDEVYHTPLDDLSYASMEPMKIVLNLYALLAMRASSALVLPANILNMANYAQAYLTSDAALASKDCGYFVQAQSALNKLKAEVTVVNDYAASLTSAYEMAKTDAERAAIEMKVAVLNNALYTARKTVNVWTMGEGGTMGSWDVFPREHQHSNDIGAINSALTSLARGRVQGALGALETVYDMEWGHYCSNETYNHILSSMYNDVMYWGGVWDQQQAYVNVLWIYAGLRDGTLSPAGASAALNNIKTTQLVPWLLQDLQVLERAWLGATSTLSVVV